jgi:hypothetical protein
MDLPSHPESEETASSMSRWQKVVAIVGIVVVLWVGSDLADIVSRGEQPAGDHGGGSGEDVPTTSAPAGQPHDPSDDDHG